MFDKALKNVTGLDGKPEEARFIQIITPALAVVERIQKFSGQLEKHTQFRIAIPRNEKGIDFPQFAENMSEAIRRHDLQYVNWGDWKL